MGGRSSRRGECKTNSKRNQGLGLRHHSSQLEGDFYRPQIFSEIHLPWLLPVFFLCFSVKVFGRLVIRRGCKWLLKWQRRVCRRCPSTSLKHIPHCWLCLLRYVWSNLVISGHSFFGITNMHTAQPCCHYRPQRSCGKVMFLHPSVSHSVHGGGCRPDTPFPRHTPLADTPPPAATSADGTHPTGMLVQKGFWIVIQRITVLLG